MSKRKETIAIAIVVSDTHCGCQFGLCPPEVALDSGSVVTYSDLQEKLWAHWVYFWETFVPEVTEGRPFVVVVNGDSIEGRHHNTTTQITANLAVQRKIAAECFRSAFAFSKPKRLFFVRGTEAHVGQSAEDEEGFAERLKAVPDEFGNFARNELWLQVGRGTAHFLHHIGVAGSQAYETSALMREYAESCVESARWGYQPPDWIVRSHRHRCTEIRVPSSNGRATVITTPAWQLKTPFAYRVAGARQTSPQIGGIALVSGHSELYTRSYVQSLARSETEVVYV